MTSHELVPVFTGNIAGQPTQLCNARDLHAFLSVGRVFASWIKDRIDEYGFSQGDDFLPVLVKSTTGRPRTEYHITLDMAKELAMIENNPQGRAVRRYFIQIEKSAIAKACGTQIAITPAPRRIKTRDDLSMTARDDEGRLINWIVPSRENQWHEHVGIGEAWFAEVVQLSQNNPKDAYHAMLTAGCALVPTWNWGHEHGFMHSFARWALAAMIEHKGILPALPFPMPSMGKPPKEGFEHYRSRAKPQNIGRTTRQNRETINKQAWAETSECARECFAKRRAALIDSAG